LSGVFWLALLSCRLDSELIGGEASMSGLYTFRATLIR
jgi:hypothetical protein